MLLALCREDVDAGSLNCRATGRCVIVVVLTETICHDTGLSTVGTLDRLIPLIVALIY
jgi:hypothetical protein